MDTPQRSLMVNPRRHHFKMKEQYVPQLRFPEFDEEWKKKTIGKILKIGSGKDHKHLGEGEIPVYGSGGVMRYADEYLYDGESIGIGRKGTIDNPIFLSGKFWTVDTLFYTHSFEEVLPRFAFSIFENINWYKYNEASGVPSLSKGTIEKIPVYTPKSTEQQKIASFLSAVDKKIEQLTRKKELLEEYKKGVMQKLFPKPGEQHPELRFKDEEDFPDWEVKPLKEILKINYGKDYKHLGDGEIPLLGTGGVMRYVDDYLYDKPSVLIGRKGSIDTPQFIDQPFWTVDTLFYTEVLNDIDPFFAYLLITTVNLLKYNEASGVPSLSASTLYSIKRSVPKSVKEQKKISKTVKSINSRIELIEKKIQQTQSFKKGLLQQMFV